MKYFSCKDGASVARYGTSRFIGAKRTADGMVIDTSKVVAIPDNEHRRYYREYTNAVRQGVLIVRTEAEFDANTPAPAVAPEPDSAPAPETTEAIEADIEPETKTKRRRGSKRTVKKDGD